MRSQRTSVARQGAAWVGAWVDMWGGRREPAVEGAAHTPRRAGPGVARAALLLASAMAAPQVIAQANTANYAFTTTTAGSLVDMSAGTTTLIVADQDDVASAVTPIGFDFFFQGVRQDRFSVNSNGTLRFGAAAVGNTAYDPLGQANQSLVTAYGADQRTRATSGKVHLRRLGSAPNRTLVVEWLDMQSNFNAAGTADLTYQVHLSESTGVIEFVYGAMTLSAAGAGDTNSNSPQFGFSSSNLAGTVGSLTAAQSGTPAPTYGASAAPVNNTYVAGPIQVLTSAADGVRRTFNFAPPPVAAPGGPLTFTAVSATSVTLNWTDSANELGYAIYLTTDGATFNYVGAAAQNATSYVMSGLVGSTAYGFRVVALNEGNTAFIEAQQTTAAPQPNIATSGLWSNPGTWSLGTVPGGNDAVTVPVGTVVTIDTAAQAYEVSVAGTLEFEPTTARTLSVAANVSVLGGGALRSAATGTQAGHVLNVAGNLDNAGSIDFSTNADTAGATLTFTGVANTAFTGSGTTDVRQVAINKGTTPASTLDLLPANFTVRGVTTDTVAGGWLTLTNGTLKLSGTFAGTSRVFGTAGYTIPATAGFWLNNPNYVVAGQNGSATNNGALRITQGVFNVGTGTGNSMALGSNSSTVVEGGAINAAGRFGVGAATNPIAYTQTGGAITVGMIGNASTTLGSFDLGTSVASSILVTGGTIVVQLPASAIDYRNQAGGGVTGVPGGTLQLGNAASGAAKTFNLRGVLPKSTQVTNTSAGHTAQMSTTLSNYNNLGQDITIASGATFSTNNVLFLMAGSMVNDGTLTANGASSNFIWFDTGASLPQSYSGTGVTTAPITATSMQATGGLTFSSDNQWVTNTLRVFAGNIFGAQKLTLGTGGASLVVVQVGNTTTPTAAGVLDAAPVFNLGTAGQTVSYLRTAASRTTGFEINPARTLTNLTFDNNDPTHTLTLAGGDLSVAGTTALTNGRLITGSNTLMVGTVNRTAGYVDGNLGKTLAAAGSRTFEVGSANGYTPVLVDATAGTFPAAVTVASVQATAPGLQPVSRAIERHWAIDATDITANLTFTYLDADVPATVTEPELQVLRHDTAGPSDYSAQGGSIDDAANTATLSGVTEFSEFTLGAVEADLGITVTDGITNAVPGGSVTYTITASNAGTVGNASATVADAFPAALTCTSTCVGSGGGTCAAGPIAGNINDAVNLPAGGSVTYTSSCVISPSATGSLSNTATVSGGTPADPNPADNSATDLDTLGASADLSITKSDGVGSVTAGGSTTYTITASNAGPSNVFGATVADTLPASLTCAWTCEGAGGGTCTAAGSGNINDTVNLAAGGSVTYTAVCDIVASATGTVSNTATVSAPAGTADPTPANNSATDSNTVETSADLAITKTNGGNELTPGGTTLYTIVASNAGPSDVVGATVTDTLPSALECTWTCQGTDGGTCGVSGSGSIVDTVNLPVDASVTYTATCDVAPSASGTVDNTASIAVPAGATDPVGGNNAATDSDTVQLVADLSITKTDGVDVVQPGGETTYTIIATNSGPSDATGASVIDIVQSGLTCSWTCVGSNDGVCSAAGNGDIEDTVDLPVGGIVTYTMDCDIAEDASGQVFNKATVLPPAGLTDTDASNDSQTDINTVGALVDLSIAKDDGVATAQVGDTLVYAITVANAGPSDAVGANLVDIVPAGLVDVAWTCVQADSTATCPMTSSGTGNLDVLVDVPAGTFLRFDLVATVAADAANASGTLTNTASIAAASGSEDSDTSNNSATDTTMVVPSGIFADGFESPSPGLNVKAAVDAHRRALMHKP